MGSDIYSVATDIGSVKNREKVFSQKEKCEKPMVELPLVRRRYEKTDRD